MTVTPNEIVAVSQESINCRIKESLSSSTSEKMNKASDEKNTGGTKRQSLSTAASSSTKSENYDHNKTQLPQAIIEFEADEANPTQSAFQRTGENVGGIIAPSRRDRQLMREVSRLGMDDDESDEEETKAMIAPTRRQLQSMRQISALDMGDPVFERGSRKKKPQEHASFIFDDMDINDVPEDMRDMISLASDRTDVVETSDDNISFDSCDLVVPLGLEPSSAANSLTSSRVTSHPKGSSACMLRGRSIRNTSAHSKSTAVQSQSSKAPSHRSSNGSSAIQSNHSETELAAQINAMLGSNSFNDSSAIGSSSHTTSNSAARSNRSRQKEAPPRQRPGLERAKGHLPRTKYAAPPLPLPTDDSIQEDARAIPASMDEIFSSKKSSGKKKNSKTKKEGKVLKMKKKASKSKE
mmetsp:Transcript_14645/g.30344  ORF Transcript_14645/g.30344 Transcript_14645/m.30344 type:complete len:410 (+) Transcript_14645:106-1335(+)